MKELRNDKRERSITDQKDYEKRINLLEILEGSNDPEVRSNFENNTNGMSSLLKVQYFNLINLL